MEVFKFFGSIGLKTDEAEKGLKGIAGEAESTASKMTQTFKKTAMAIGTVFAVGKVIDFGKMAVEASANAQAMEAQFSQIFGEMDEQAQASLDRVADNVGALPNRLKPAFNQIASFAKVNGMETAESISFSERAMQAAADSAAFYDKSIEDTTDTLQSYLKGNFDVADNLGILSTETTRNAKATEMFGEKYSDLSGIQQQEVLLAMYEEANELSGAMGQASREADGWENVMGNLKQSWQDFLAVVGAPILKAVIPIVKGITKGVVALSKIITPVATAIGDVFGNVITVVQSLWDILFGSQSGKDNTDLMKEMGISDNTIGMVTKVVEIVKGLQSVISGYWQSLVTSATNVWNQVKEVFTGVVNWYIGTYSAIWDTISQWWNTNQSGFLDTAMSVWDTIKNTFQVVADFVMGVFMAVWEPLKAFFIENQDLIRATFVTVWNAILAVIKFVMDYIVPYLVDRWNSIMNFIIPILEFIKNSISVQFNYILGIIKAVMQLIQGDWSGAWDTIVQTATDYVTGMLEAITSLMGGILEAIVTNVTAMYDAVVEWFGKIPDWIDEKWTAVMTFFEGINLFDIGAGIINGLWDGLKSVWTGVEEWVEAKLDWLPGFAKDALGINSPSRVFRDDIGRWIPAGLGEGIEDNWNYVEDAMDSTNKRLVNTKFSLPAVDYTTRINPADYTFKASNTATTPEYTTTDILIDELIQLTKQLVEKDSNLYVEGQVFGEVGAKHINRYNETQELRKKRIQGGIL